MKYLLTWITLSICSFALSQITVFDSELNDSINYFLSKQNQSFEIEQPMLIIKGKAFQHEKEISKELRQIRKKDIQNFTFLGEEIDDLDKLWGPNAKNGVLVFGLHEKEKKEKKDINESNIIYIYDGKIISQNEIEKLNKDSIKSVQVLKNNFELHDAKTYDGIIIITPFISIR